MLEKHSRPQMSHVKAIPGDVDLPALSCRCYLLDLLASWCCARVTSDRNSPLHRACCHQGRSWATFSKLEGIMPKIVLEDILSDILEKQLGATNMSLTRRKLCIKGILRYPSIVHSADIGEKSRNTSWGVELSLELLCL